jgi:hypothetical protein
MEYRSFLSVRPTLPTTQRKTGVLPGLWIKPLAFSVKDLSVGSVFYCRPLLSKMAFWEPASCTAFETPKCVEQVRRAALATENYEVATVPFEAASSSVIKRPPETPSSGPQRRFSKGIRRRPLCVKPASYNPRCGMPKARLL